MLITVSDNDKPAVIEVARRFSKLGFNIMATTGTHEFLTENGIESDHVNKVYEKRPHITDIIKNGDIQMVVNTPRGKTSKANDAYIRKSSIIHKVPYVTTVAAALAAVMGIEAFKADTSEVKSLQEYHSDIGS